MVDLPQDESTSKAVVTDPPFKRVLYSSRKGLQTFLQNLSDQIQARQDVEISGEEWTIPFDIDDQVTIEIELDADDRNDRGELEIEISFVQA